VYWLTRLLRDADSRVRSGALTVLGHLLTPGAYATQRLLAAAWPDAAPRLMRTAVDGGQPYAVRAGALRFLTLALALPDQLVDNLVSNTAAHIGDNNGGRALIPLTRESLLKQAHFWEALPSLLLEPAAPPGFLHAALSLLLQGLSIDPEAFATHLKHPGVLPLLAGMLADSGSEPSVGAEVRRRLANAAITPQGVAATCACAGGGGAVAVLTGSTWWGKASMLPVTVSTAHTDSLSACDDLVCAASGLHVSTLLLPVQAAHGGGGGGGDSTSTQRAEQSHRDVDGVLQGLNVARQLLSQPKGDEEPSHAAARALSRNVFGDSSSSSGGGDAISPHASDVLACCGDAAALVCAAVMEAPLVDTAALGYTHPELLQRCLTALVCLGHQTTAMQRYAGAKIHRDFYNSVTLAV
jgi:hypothetical protein